jgi:hypothetical protein
VVGLGAGIPPLARKSGHTRIQLRAGHHPQRGVAPLPGRRRLRTRPASRWAVRGSWSGTSAWYGRSSPSPKNHSFRSSQGSADVVKLTRIMNLCVPTLCREKTTPQRRDARDLINFVGAQLTKALRFCFSRSAGPRRGRFGMFPTPNLNTTTETTTS